MKSFLKVPQKVHHGLLIVAELAGRNEDARPVSLESVARKAGVSQGFLEETAALLRRAGLIKGLRGKGGGYVLSKKPAKITVAEVIAAVEGPIAMMSCLAGAGACPLAGSCSSRDVWKKVQNQLISTLAGMTVADLV